MGKWLRKLHIDRVDLVDRGANQHARVSLFKRDTPGVCPECGAELDPETGLCPKCDAEVTKGGGENVNTIWKRVVALAHKAWEGDSATIQDPVSSDDWPSLLDTFGKSIAWDLIAEKNPAESLHDTIEEFLEKAAIYTPSNWEEIAKYDRATSTLGEVVGSISKNDSGIPEATLAKLGGALDALYDLSEESHPDNEESEEGDDDMKKTLDTVLASLDSESQTIIKSALESIGKRAPGLPEDVKKRIDDLEARAISAETVAKVERDARVTKEFEATARTFRGLGIDAATFAPILKVLNEKAPKETKTVIEILTKASVAATEQNKLLGEIGSSQMTIGGDAYAKLEGFAEELRKSDTTLTKESAIAKAIMQHTDLYREYESEKKGVL